MEGIELPSIAGSSKINSNTSSGAASSVRHTKDSSTTYYSTKSSPGYHPSNPQSSRQVVASQDGSIEPETSSVPSQTITQQEYPAAQRRFSFGNDEPQENLGANQRLSRYTSASPERWPHINTRSFFTEDADVKRDLGVWDVAALVTNKMIGAGFFTTTGQVLLLTGSKNISIGLWAAGGIYSLISFSIYLEYGLQFPFNGGDLIYASTLPSWVALLLLTNLQLDRIFPYPPLFMSVIYSIFFICFATAVGNALAFARLCIAAAVTDIDKTSEFDKRLVDLISISILTVVCLLLYFSKEVGRALNRWLMVYKAGLLLTVFVAGALVRKESHSGSGDWNNHYEHTGFGSVSAGIYILYSYQGWENANYVTGEIKDVDKGTLKKGGFLGVILTTILYILGTIGYFWACDFDTIVSQKSDLGMAHYFAERVFHGKTTGFKVCIAISAVGNIIAVIYTNSTVKQSIALQQFVPFYRFFSKTDQNFGTPSGALVLQWLSAIPFILVVPNSTDGYSFLVGIYSYLHLFVLMIIGFGLFKIEWMMHQASKMKLCRHEWSFKFLRQRWIRWSLVTVFIVANGLVIGVSTIPRHGSIPRWIWPCIAGGLLIYSVLYWLALCSFMDNGFLSRCTGVHATINTISEDGTMKTLTSHTNSMSGLNANIFTSSRDRTANHRSEAITTENQSQIQRDGDDPALAQERMDDFQQMMRKARLDGSLHRVTWEVEDGLYKSIRSILRGMNDLFIKYVW